MISVRPFVFSLLSVLICKIANTFVIEIVLEIDELVGLKITFGPLWMLYVIGTFMLFLLIEWLLSYTIWPYWLLKFYLQQIFSTYSQLFSSYSALCCFFFFLGGVFTLFILSWDSSYPSSLCKWSRWTQLRYHFLWMVSPHHSTRSSPYPSLYFSHSIPHRLPFSSEHALLLMWCF